MSPKGPAFRSEYADVPLRALIPALSPHLRAPEHLPKLLDAFERAARGEPVRALCSFPIRSWKTKTLAHGICRALAADPTRRIIFMGNTHQRAQAIGKEIRELAAQTDFGPTSGWNTIEEWRNSYGGGVAVMSSDQSRLGLDCHMLVCDDPLDELMAVSEEKRRTVDEHISHYTFRCIRDGKKGPVIIIMSRWDNEDPIGLRLLRKQEDWEYIYTPGILDMGEPNERSFAEEIWPLAVLHQELRIEAETDPQCRRFWAQIMGVPRAPGREEFGEPARYHELPLWPGFRDGIGIDMAFTATRRADHFAFCAGRVHGGTLFVRELKRMHADISLVEAEIAAAWVRYGRCPVFTYFSGPEKAGLDHLMLRGIPVCGMHARWNKYVRAQGLRRDWNASKVLFPLEQWVVSPVQRIRNFRGNEGDPDDELDALVSLHAGLIGNAVDAPRAFGKPRL